MYHSKYFPIRVYTVFGTIKFQFKYSRILKLNNFNVYGENYIDLDFYDTIKDGTNSVFDGVMHRQFRYRSALNTTTFH